MSTHTLSTDVYRGESTCLQDDFLVWICINANKQMSLQTNIKTQTTRAQTSRPTPFLQGGIMVFPRHMLAVEKNLKNPWSISLSHAKQRLNRFDHKTHQRDKLTSEVPHHAPGICGYRSIPFDCHRHNSRDNVVPQRSGYRLGMPH